nr:4'-phosphopantetheinyl transferase superfamily protein [Paenibacillus phyllosphaerae]
MIIDCESVGIDIEKVVPISPELADRVFSAQESMDLRQKPEHERVNLFFELWTLKESYIKAVGVGLTLSLKSFTIRKLPGGEITLDPPAERYHFKQYDLNTHYKLSVCSSSPQLPGSVEILGLDDLL